MVSSEQAPPMTDMGAMTAALQVALELVKAGVLTPAEMRGFLGLPAGIAGKTE